jgi:nicotinamidase-related amidase
VVSAERSSGSALIAIDLQQGLCGDPQGGQQSPLSEAVANRGVIAAAAEAMEIARGGPSPVIHVRLAFDDTYGNRTNRTARFDEHESAQRFLSGSESTRFRPEVQPRPGEPVLEKGSVGPFASTPLAAVLASRGVESIFLCGVATHLAIESAAREAADRGLQVAVIEPACAAPGDLHDYAVEKSIPLFADLIGIDELGRRLGVKTTRQGGR